jgi:class 3 adenylate cyclase
MVLINAPVEVPDPSLRAIDLALEIQEVVQGLIARWRERRYQIGLGLGLAMGKATVGRIGTDTRSDYTAIGSVVNLASRLCASAADREILANGKLAEAAAGRRELLPLGVRNLKGFDEPLRIYSVAVPCQPGHPLGPRLVHAREGGT